VSDGDWVRGGREAKVVVIEYADFQCPACANYSELVHRLSDEYGDRVAFVFRHFPLKKIHSNAEIMAYATEAAGRQDKFWEMHDLVFARQQEWSDERDVQNMIEGYARELELDVDRLQADLETDEIKQAVDSQYNSAIRLGLNSTPTFFLNEDKLESVRSYDQFKQALEDALEKAGT